MSQKFDAVTEEDEGAGLLYVLLLPFTDRDGRIEGSESVVRSLVYPRKDSVSIAKIGKRLSLLHDHGLIVWYVIDGEKYIQITKFKTGQKNMRYDREAESIIPSPEINKINSGSTPDQLRSDSGSNPVEEKRREEKFKRNSREDNSRDESRSKSQYKKHKYGEYEHVLLTDEERGRLITDWGESKFLEMVKKLDEGIELKGYKYKSHNLALRKWESKETEDVKKTPEIHRWRDESRRCSRCGRLFEDGEDEDNCPICSELAQESQRAVN